MLIATDHVPVQCQEGESIEAGRIVTIQKYNENQRTMIGNTKGNEN